MISTTWQGCGIIVAPSGSVSKHCKQQATNQLLMVFKLHCWWIFNCILNCIMSKSFLVVGPGGGRGGGGGEGIHHAPKMQQYSESRV